MTRVLIVEDNQDLAYGLRNNLEIEGYDVATAADGNEGVRMAGSFNPALIILDLMLPGMDGFDVLKTLRDKGNAMPVLILTARGEELDKVQGLRLGADDYVTKPFGLMELLARVEALLRRAGEATSDSSGQSCEILQIAGIELCPRTRTVKRNGTVVDLAPKEFDLLRALLRHDGAVVSRVDLMKQVWGHTSVVVSRTVDTHIAELRRKLEDDPTNPTLILTVRKIGYRVARDSSPHDDDKPQL